MSISRPVIPPIISPIISPIIRPSAVGPAWETGAGGGNASLRAFLGTECTLLCDERGQTDSGAGKLTAWANQIDPANPLVQSTDGNRPATGQTIAGFPAPDFDGVDDYMIGLAISSYISQTLGWHAFAIVRPDTHDATDGSFYDEDLIWGDATGYVGESLALSGAHAGHFDASTKQTAYQAISDSAVSIIESSWNATTISHRLNAGATVTVASGTPDVVTGLLRLGSRGAAGKFDGRMAFIAICNRQLPASRASAIRQMLASKYGVSV
jgi:hypothetical protein